MISYLHRMSAPIRLSTILQIAQLTALRTYNFSSNNSPFSPLKVYLLIFDSPSFVDKSRPSRRVASRRMLTTLQWVKAEARPTHPCSIMLPKWHKIYSFQLRHWPFRWAWWESWYSDQGWVILWVVFRWVWGWPDRKRPCRLLSDRSGPWRVVRGRDVVCVIAQKWCGADKTA